MNFNNENIESKEVFIQKLIIENIDYYVLKVNILKEQMKYDKNEIKNRCVIRDILHCIIWLETQIKNTFDYSGFISLIDKSYKYNKEIINEIKYFIEDYNKSNYKINNDKANIIKDIFSIYIN